MKISDTEAKALHDRYRADRRETLETLAPEAGITSSGLRRRWRRLGLPCDSTWARGQNIVRKEDAALLQADLDAMAAAYRERQRVAAERVAAERAALIAKREARAESAKAEDLKKADQVQAAWTRYPVEGVGDLAKEIGWNARKLLSVWRGMGLDPNRKMLEARKSKVIPSPPVEAIPAPAPVSAPAPAAPAIVAPPIDVKADRRLTAAVWAAFKAGNKIERIGADLGISPDEVRARIERTRAMFRGAE